MIKLYDSRTNKYVSIDENDISIYNCGPTVYNHIHIGNARPLIVFDVLYRLFKYLKKNVKYVLNITDIDDKIINEAAKQNMDELQLSNYYTEQYLLIKKQLNTLEMINPKVSDNIDGVIEYINTIIESNGAYIVDGNVYFDTKRIPQYGEISKRNIDELLHGARVDIDNNKKNQNDFVLWKKTNIGLKWNTEWSLGRPGWHSECSFLINKLIGKQVTIHGGGMDLKFPHHENENAQNIAIHNCSLAKVWMHIGMINIDNKKMSKSLNNFILVKDILNKYRYQALRWFFYQSNYSNPLNYSDEIMHQMEIEISKFEKTINIAKTLLIINNVQIHNSNNEVLNIIINELENNLNINNAISHLYKLNKEINLLIKNKNLDSLVQKLTQLINSLKLLGIEFDNIHSLDNIQLIHEWNNLVLNKDYLKADELRTILVKKGLL